MTFAEVNTNVLIAFALMMIAFALSYLAFGRESGKVSRKTS